MKAATMSFLHYGNSSHLQYPSLETLPALIFSISSFKRSGAQRRLLQISRLLRENAYLIILNDRSFNIRLRKHQPRSMMKTVRIN